MLRHESVDHVLGAFAVSAERTAPDRYGPGIIRKRTDAEKQGNRNKKKP